MNTVGVVAFRPVELHGHWLVQQLGELEPQVSGFLNPSCGDLEGRLAAPPHSGPGRYGFGNLLPACRHSVEAGHAGAGVTEEPDEVLDHPAVIPILDLAAIGEKSALRQD